MGAVILALGTIGAVSVYRSSMAYSLYAQSIMSVLGFSNPKVVNLSQFCLALCSDRGAASII
jgi:hypothetical protein